MLTCDKCGCRRLDNLSIRPCGQAWCDTCQDWVDTKEEKGIGTCRCNACESDRAFFRYLSTVGHA